MRIPWGQQIVRWGLLGAGLASCAFGVSGTVWAQVVDNEAVVIETNIDVEQVVDDPVDAPVPSVTTEFSPAPRAPVEEAAQGPGIIVTPEDVSRTSRALRQAIEKNREFLLQNRQLEEEVKVLRGDQRLQRNRADALEEQVGAYRQQVDQAVELKEEMVKKVEDLAGRMQDREGELLGRIRTLEQMLSEQQKLAEQMEQQARRPRGGAAAGTGSGDGTGGGPSAETLGQGSGLDVLAMIEDLEQTRQQIREDEARVHYNMGNIFFHQGNYIQAAYQYERAVELNPGDAHAHFNLAYVCGDFLKDFEKALTHYRQYLFLNPQADDAVLVGEKIVEAQTYGRIRMDELRIDKDVNKNYGKNYAW